MTDVAPGLPPSTKPIEMFDQVLKTQGEFWCPICNLWFKDTECQTVVEHPQADPQGRIIAHILFGMCEKCLSALNGTPPAEAARLAIAERHAKGVADLPRGKQLKFLVMRKKPT